MTKELLAANFVAALEQALGAPHSPISLHEPEFAGNEWTYVKECIDSGWVSSVGKYVNEFELRLAQYTGAKHVIAVVNGTAALHAALLVSGVKPGEEVLVPALTFVGTANAVAHSGAIPHFVDSSEDTLGIAPEALASYLRYIAEPVTGGFRNRTTGRRLAALVPMHTFGHPVDMHSLISIAQNYNLPIVEDAAESLGSWIGERHTGTFGQMGVLSFNGNKVITTGGGGAILTDDAEFARHLIHLTTTAKRPHAWEFYHDEVAFNYRLPNLNAALGCGQLERLPDMLARKRMVANAYRSAFSSKVGMRFVCEPRGCHSNYWLNAIRLDDPDKDSLDALLNAANSAGYQCRPVWRLMHHLPMFQASPRAPLPIAETLELSLVNVPSSVGLR